jgi:hypothetical protein
MDKEIAKLATLSAAEVYGQEHSELETFDDSFVPTPECGSDCYDNERHSTLCPHSSKFDQDLPF